MGVEYAFELVLCHRGERIGGGGALVGLFGVKVSGIPS